MTITPSIGLPQTNSRLRAFTLLEVVLVIVILAVLAGIVIPFYRDYELDTKAAAMSQVVQRVRTRIQTEHKETGAYAASVDPSWFDDALVNVFSDAANKTAIFVVDNGSHIYPSQKTFSSASGFTMWYNQGNGSFCVRVPPQDTNAESMELFNRVNGANVTSMSQRN